MRQYQSSQWCSNGRWIKGMAGDDSLMPDAIQSYVEFCNQSNCQVCVSGAYFMDEESNPLDIEGEKSLWNHYIEDLECTYPEQKTMIKHHCFAQDHLCFSQKMYGLLLAVAMRLMPMLMNG